MHVHPNRYHVLSLRRYVLTCVGIPCVFILAFVILAELLTPRGGVAIEPVDGQTMREATQALIAEGMAARAKVSLVYCVLFSLLAGMAVFAIREAHCNVRSLAATRHGSVLWADSLSGMAVSCSVSWGWRQRDSNAVVGDLFCSHSNAWDLYDVQRLLAVCNGKRHWVVRFRCHLTMRWSRRWKC